MHKPIAVFDAGIGSYALVAEIQRRIPTQDVVYFADRASFPYGNKGRERLLSIMRRTINFLENYDPSAIVVASNAPSIMVMDEIRQYSSVPLFGVFPPLQEALSRSKSGHIGIMGVHSLINSESLRLFVERHAAEHQNVTLINASPMVELVENGSFLFHPAETQLAVSTFVDKIFRQTPLIDILTLSSTHLPWLRAYFEAAYPDCQYMDPAEMVVTEIGEGVKGTGQILGLVTESENYDVKTFQKMLAKCEVEIPLELVSLP